MKIAILDDDKNHLDLIAQGMLTPREEWSNDVTCQSFESAEDLFAALKEHSFDCFILDRQLPTINGDEVLAWLRQNTPSDTVIVMLSSLIGPEEVVKMLSLGADDYVAKPFNADELAARVHRLLKRRNQQQNTVRSNEFWLLNLLFNRAALTIKHGENVIECSAREFALVEFLFNHVGQPLSREKIFEAVWQRRSVNTSRALDTQIHRVRQKIGLTIENGFVLQPIYGIGYRLDVVKDHS